MHMWPFIKVNTSQCKLAWNLLDPAPQQTRIKFLPCLPTLKDLSTLTCPPEAGICKTHHSYWGSIRWTPAVWDIKSDDNLHSGSHLPCVDLACLRFIWALNSLCFIELLYFMTSMKSPAITAQKPWTEPPCSRQLEAEDVDIRSNKDSKYQTCCVYFAFNPQTYFL